MDEPVVTPPAPPQPSKPATWVIVLVVVLVLCCCLFGIAGLLFAFGPEILSALGF
ncbi:MAG: hypothetical protein HY781_06380 [Chloroflexi bacterium]|nr:hypothetical protein [Chloroflexota bacterium]